METRPDFTVIEKEVEWGTEPPLLLSATIQNIGGLPAHGVRVRFLDGTLEKGTQIGTDQIIEELASKGRAVVSVPWHPNPGMHQVTVVIDPPSSRHPQGTIVEQNERNNGATKTFIGNRFLLTSSGMNTPIQSTDGNLSLSISSGSLPGNLVLLLNQRSEIAIVDQPDLRYAPPASNRATTEPVEPDLPAYQVDLVGEAGDDITARLTFKYQPPGINTTDRGKGGASRLMIYRRDEDTQKWISMGGDWVSGNRIFAEVTLPGIYALLVNNDFTPPEINLTVEHQGFIDGDYVSESPVISATLSDANGIDLRPDRIIVMKNREIVPATEYTISASPTNFNLALLSYTPTLRTGPHHITLQAQDANTNIAQGEMQFRVAGEFEIEKVANYPNPFVPGTRIRQGTDFAYILTSDADKVILKIYTITGRLVVSSDTLDGFAGYNEFHWEGMDGDDEELSNGVYLYKIIAEKGKTVVERTGKLAVLR